MMYSPLAIKRRHVLGDLYGRCDNIVSVPVYLEDVEGEMIGYADESLGHYADAFLFHLPEDVCKKLSTGHFVYSFNYDFSDPSDNGPTRKRRVTLINICLSGRKVPDAASRPVQKVKLAV
ncbi:MAG TPA: hypothetical protein VL327_13735 [Pyrinomonadaceae bacterium]|jgi:hypothetical protein|nr:hypothetical protein [Pyrinomonadaceae bacterium]